MATLSDVARRVGVSVSTVSRVLSDAPGARVGLETRARIHQAAKELQYRPHFAARALKYSRTNVIAVVVPDLTNTLFAELMRGIEDEGHERGFLVLLARAEALAADPAARSRLMAEGRVDGVLVQISNDVGVEEMRPMWEGKLPVVFVNSVNAERPGSVVLDDAAATRLATEHLVQLGHRRIGYLGGKPVSGSAQRSLKGYQSALLQGDIKFDAALVTEYGHSLVEGREGLEALIEYGAPTGVVVANLNAAIGALQEARRRGVRVPEDLSIIAVHDVVIAENTWPQLTAVRMPLYELGRAAMAAICEEIEGAVPEDQVVTTPRPVLIERESTSVSLKSL